MNSKKNDTVGQDTLKQMLLRSVALAAMVAAISKVLAGPLLDTCGDGTYSLDNCGAWPSCASTDCTVYWTPDYACMPLHVAYWCETGGPWTTTGNMRKGHCGPNGFGCMCWDDGGTPISCEVRKNCVDSSEEGFTSQSPGGLAVF